MKISLPARSVVFPILLLLGLLPVASLPALTVESNTLQAVQVHPQGVRVTRALVVAPGDGQMIEIDALPAKLDVASVRLTAPPESAFRIAGFEFSADENKVEPLDPRTGEERARVAAVEREIELIQSEIQMLDARVQQHRELAQSVRAALAQDAASAVFELGLSAWEKYEAVKNEAESRKRELNETLPARLVEQAEARKALEKAVAELNARAGVLRFAVSGSLTERTALTLHYQLAEAGWNPVYEIRATPADGSLEWVYKARLWQRTGEDWDKVEVALSSAMAFDPRGLPELPPLILDRADERYRKSVGSFTMDSAPALAPPPPAQAGSTTTGFFAVLAEPVSLASGAPAAVHTAFQQSLTADFWSEATPEISTEAWLVAGLTNDLGWPILAGEAYFFIDAQLVSRRALAAVAAGEDFELALGRNEKIGLERRERLRKESTSGLIDKTRRHEIEFETTVHNRMPVAHRVVLRDRFPVSRNNKIQVDPRSPGDVEVEEGTGLFKWEKTVPAGATAVVKTEYTVTYPTEWTVYPEL